MKIHLKQKLTDIGRYINERKTTLLTASIIIGVLSSVPNLANAGDDNVTFRIDEDNATKLLSMIKNTSTDNKLNYIYDLDGALDILDELEEVDEHEVNVYNEESVVLDYNMLFQIVKRNNENYIPGLYDKEMAAYYIMYSDEELLEICQIISEEINYFTTKYSEINRDSLGCLLYGLKIFRIPEAMFEELDISFFVGKITDDNCMIFDEEVFEERRKRLHESLKAYKRRLIAHEVQHLLQSECSCYRVKNGLDKMGISLYSDEEGINPLYWGFLNEASDETQIDPKGRIDKYYDERMYLNLLNYCVFLKSDAGSNELKDLPLTKDINRFFTLFDAKSDEEKKEILRMMTGIQINLYQDDYDIWRRIANAYGEENGEGLYDDEYSIIAYQLKISSLETLIKIFYQNLITSNLTNDVTLSDNFYLMNLLETMVSSHLEYSDEYNDINSKFNQFYQFIQESMFRLLSPSLESIDELKMSYTNYKEENDLELPSNGLEWLPRDKKTFVENELLHNPNNRER